MMRHAWVVIVLLALTSCRTLVRPRAVEAPAPSTPHVFFYAESHAATAKTVVLPESGVTLRVGPEPLFTESDVLQVDAVQAELGRCLLFQVTPASAHLLAERATASDRIVLVVDDRAIGALRLDGTFSDGRVYMFVEVPDAELSDLAGALRKAVAAGANLPRIHPAT